MTILKIYSKGNNQPVIISKHGYQLISSYGDYDGPITREEVVNLIYKADRVEKVL